MFETLKKFFKKPEERKMSWEDELKELGISIVVDKRFETRQETILEIERILSMPEDKFLKWLKEKGKENIDYEPIPENLVHALEAKLHALNHIISSVSLPFGRAGDNPWFARICVIWSKLFHWSLEIITTVTTMMEKIKTGYRYILFYQLRSFLNMHIYPCGKSIIGFCFRHMDVTPSKAVIIQQFAQPYTPVIPGAQRPLEKEPPPDKQYPPELSTEIDGD